MMLKPSHTWIRTDCVLIIQAEFDEPGILFLTPVNFFQQVTAMTHPQAINVKKSKTEAQFWSHSPCEKTISIFYEAIKGLSLTMGAGESLYVKLPFLVPHNSGV